MDYSYLSIIPPIVAIILAIITKEVIISLLAGVFVGGLIYTNGNLIVAIEEIVNLMGNKVGENGLMLVFLALLGSLVMVMNKAGGSFAYGKWANTKIKNKKAAKLATAILGMLIFIDDYFNCLTIGAVMKPISDKNGVSRAKLAHIIDSSAAPICILAPVSSWAASVVAIIGDSGIQNPMREFIKSIPFNLYAILTIFIVLYFCFSDFEIGKMQEYEINDTSIDTTSGDVGYEYSKNAKVIDLLFPVITLITVTVLMMLRTGGYFDDGIAFGEAFGNANVNMSLVVGVLIALVFSFVMYIPRRLVSLKAFMEAVTEGMKTMISAISILVLAWTIGGITSASYLNTGGFLGGLLLDSTLPMWLLPILVFFVASALSFSTGTAWGTFGILIPIVVPILISTNNLDYLSIVLAAVFSGSVFGDHCSPISDTTILSSAGAGCNHLVHVSTQLPYAFVCAVGTVIGFMFVGITSIDLLAIPVGIVTVILMIYILKNKNIKKESMDVK